MPNNFAYLMLFIWPVVALVLFKVMSLQKALIWTLLGGYLVLPSATGVKLPMVPALDKHTIPAISALVFCKIYTPRKLSYAFPMTAGELVMTFLLIILLVGSPILTVLTNFESVSIGPRTLPGMRFYDAFSITSDAMVSILPFFLAKRYLNTPEAHREILRAFVIGGLAYSLLAMIEVRLSPQLHTWIYGFFPHDFIQHIRAGGFRPIVFLNHGLMVGMFFCLSSLAALILWRESRREGKPARTWGFAVLWLMVTLMMVKSVGALVIAFALSLIIGFTGKRLQLLFFLIVTGVVLLYPILRSTSYIPVDEIYDLVLNFSEDRAQSLKFRFDNEDALLAHANEKPLAGWGGWGRNQLYDPTSGRIISVTDGIWIIIIGVYGWIGYTSYFGLFTFPILLIARNLSGFGASLITPGLMIMLSAVLIDFLPNAGLVPYVWMMTGALAGRALQQTGVVEGKAKKISQNGRSPLKVLIA